MLINKISVVIPTVKIHDKYLEELIYSLSSDKDVICQIIIARSRLNDGNVMRYITKLEAFVKSAGFPPEVLILSSTQKQENAASNRNRGGLLATGEYICFCDADDLYTRGRLSLALKLLYLHKGNMLVHNYANTLDECDNPLLFDINTLVVDSEKIYNSTFNTPRQRNQEGTKAGDTNLLIPLEDISEKYANVHHGHIVVSNKAFQQVKYGTLERGEDGQFCRDVLENCGAVIYIPLKLSAYRSSLSAGRDIRLIDKLKINRIIKLFLNK